MGLHRWLFCLVGGYDLGNHLTTKDTKDSAKGTKEKMEEDRLARRVVDQAMAVHTALGPGLLESTYEECLSYKLEKQGFKIDRQKDVPIVFEEIELDRGYRLDLLVEKKLLIEIKSVEALNDVHLAQTLTYLKLGGFKLGLLLNFNVLHMKEGIRRVIN